MDTTQNVPQVSPDSLHTMPEVTGIQAQLDAMTDQKSETAATQATEKASSVQAAQAATAAAHDASASTPAMPPPITDTPLEVLPTNNNPMTAEDNDLIEHEWIEKAKAIVDATRDNPNKQSDEMSKFKADYIKKRYKRDIKVSEA
jgi:hypothetical protein